MVSLLVISEQVSLFQNIGIETVQPAQTSRVNSVAEAVALLQSHDKPEVEPVLLLLDTTQQNDAPQCAARYTRQSYPSRSS